MSQHVRNKKFFLEEVAIQEQEVYNYLISLTGEPQLAEDLLQDTMERAWKKLGQLREPEKVKSWLFSIAKNQVNQYYRKLECEYSYIDELNGEYDENLDSIRERADVLEELVNEFEITSMKKALNLLDLKYKRLIVMYYCNGITQKDIAEMLNENYSTVRVNLVRALKKVREIRDRIERGEVDVNGK